MRLRAGPKDGNQAVTAVFRVYAVLNYFTKFRVLLHQNLLRCTSHDTKSMYQFAHLVSGRPIYFILAWMKMVTTYEIHQKC